MALFKKECHITVIVSKLFLASFHKYYFIELNKQTVHFYKNNVQ